MAKIRQIEGDAMLKQRPQIGLIELMDYLERRGMRKAICTRNFESVYSGSDRLRRAYSPDVEPLTKCSSTAHQSTT